MTSAGSMSGVNCRRENFTFRQCGQRFDGERLGQARHAFEQDVAVGEQADDQPLDQIVLADDDLADFVEERPHEGAGFLHRFVDGVDSCIHFGCEILLLQWTKN